MFFGEFPVQPGRQIQSNHYYLLIIFFSTLERKENLFSGCDGISRTPLEHFPGVSSENYH